MSKSVLVVDDSDMMRRLIIKSLRACKADIQVHEAKDGLDAMDKFSNATIDLVVTDWNMPNMNGLELVVEIRKTNKEVPIVMVTTEGSVEKVKQAILAGANNYIAKPFPDESFKAKFSRIL